MISVDLVRTPLATQMEQLVSLHKNGLLPPVLGSELPPTGAPLLTEKHLAKLIWLLHLTQDKQSLCNISEGIVPGRPQIPESGAAVSHG